MTLREFLEEVNAHEHYRIYQPNRDCLIFESYFKIHSPYTFKQTDDIDSWYQMDYYDNNDYCNDVYFGHLDEETEIFLERFGNYIVCSLECSTFRPRKMYKGEDDKIHFEYKRDSVRPHIDYLECFNVFIIPPHSEL